MDAPLRSGGNLNPTDSDLDVGVDGMNAITPRHREMMMHDVNTIRRLIFA